MNRNRRLAHRIFLTVVFFSMPGTAIGQLNNPYQLSMPPNPPLKIRDVQPKVFGLGNTLLVTVENWTFPADLKLNRTAWRLKLEGIPLPSVTAEAIETETPGKAVFRFYLARDATSGKEWDALLRYPLREPRWVRPVRVGIEPQEDFGASITPLSDGTQLIILARRRFYRLLGFMALVIVILVVLGVRSKILRGPRGIAYSLGRTQMAWWFVIILASYLFLGLLTFDWNSTITTSALALMGISASTAFGSVMIDSDKTRKAEQTISQRELLPDQIQAMKQKIEQAKSAAEISALNAELTEMHGKLDQANATSTVRGYKSKGFAMDLISDSNGVSLHRFQNVVWTLVLGGVYAGSVLTELNMPEFNATLLSLMGISSGTYVAFKYPEK